VVEDDVDARAGRQRRQALEQGDRLEAEVRGSVAPRRLEGHEGEATGTRRLGTAAARDRHGRGGSEGRPAAERLERRDGGRHGTVRRRSHDASHPALRARARGPTRRVSPAQVVPCDAGKGGRGQASSR